MRNQNCVAAAAAYVLQVVLILAAAANYIQGLDLDLDLDRSSFPPDFIFGSSSSSYQYEGATRVDGRGPSIWDAFVTTQSEKITDHSSGDVATDFYNLYKEDIAKMKEIGLDSFRFSISCILFLDGKISEGINQKGVDFYNFLIDQLISSGIEPMVTLFHWDLPQALEDEYAGFLSPNIVNDFRNYADFCFREFGDRVRHWITINEPNLFSNYGYTTGEQAPGRCSTYIGNCTQGNSATEPYLVSHHSILSHAAAVFLYRNKYQSSQKGSIGVVIQTRWLVPKFHTTSSQKAASRGLDFIFGWILHPMTYGDYPKTMKDSVGNRLPKFTKEESDMIKGSLDFIGVNYYTARYADDYDQSYTNIPLSYTTDSRVNATAEKNGFLIGEPSALSCLYIYPKGIRDILLYLKRNYNNPTIIVTENGVADLNNYSLPINEALKDNVRIEYHRRHLSNILEAIEDGVNVKGYYIWSFLDNFEWQSGYTARFGIYFIDFENGLKRYPKTSAFWFKKFLKTFDTPSSLILSQ